EATRRFMQAADVQGCPPRAAGGRLRICLRGVVVPKPAAVIVAFPIVQSGEPQMTPDEIALIHATHTMIRPMAGQAALLFEMRLAEIAPDMPAPGGGLFAALDRA